MLEAVVEVFSTSTVPLLGGGCDWSVSLSAHPSRGLIFHLQGRAIVLHISSSPFRILSSQCPQDKPPPCGSPVSLSHLIFLLTVKSLADRLASMNTAPFTSPTVALGNNDETYGVIYEVIYEVIQTNSLSAMKVARDIE